MKNCKFKAFCVAMVLASAYANAVNSNVVINNDSPVQEYFKLTDNFYNGASALVFSMQPGSSKTIVFNEGENHFSGRIYISDSPITSLATSGHYQLVEYSIGNTSGHEFTDYDFSAVDALDNIPVALEAVNQSGKSIGWSGMSNSQDQAYLNQQISLFTSQSGWPTFAKTSTKVPGGANLFAFAPSNFSSSANTMISALKSKWLFWISGTPAAVCADPRVLGERSVSDCQKFAQAVQTLNNFAPVMNNLSQIYGFVGPYNTSSTASTYAPIVISLLRGVAESTDITNLYPDYSSMYSLDPYVSFIHRSDKLNMQIYAFSIDDSIGNFWIPGIQTFYVDVGSTNSLPVQTPFLPKASSGIGYNLSFGPNWDGTKVTLGSNVTNITESVGATVVFGKSLFDNGSLVVSLSNPQLSFSATIAMSSDGTFTKSNCVLGGVSDPSCSSSSDWVGSQMIINGSTISLPANKTSSSGAGTKYYVSYGAGSSGGASLTVGSKQTVTTLANKGGSISFTSSDFVNNILPIAITNGSMSFYGNIGLSNGVLTLNSCYYNGVADVPNNNSTNGNYCNDPLAKSINIDVKNNTISLPANFPSK